jgi:hypothetical protein
MADSSTSNYEFIKPEVGASEDSWGEKLNQNFDDIDQLLTGDGLLLVHVAFDTTSTHAVAKGEIAWNLEEGTFDAGLNSGGAVLQLGEETLYRVSNRTGSLIPDGTLCMAAGTLGNSGRIKVAPWDGSVPSKYIIGVATTDILNDNDGYVTHFGKVRGIQTNGANYGESWEDGEVLFAGATGGLTKTMPEAPNTKTTIAIVIRAHGSSGTLFVRPTYGSKLDEDELVQIDSLADGDILQYNATAGRFENVSNAALQALVDEAQGYANSAAVDAEQAGLDAEATAADRVQTGLDAQATAADRVQTGLDAQATAADRIQTGLDAQATAADAAQTALDVIATAADAAQTALDVIATAADRVQTGLDAQATAADRVQTGLDADATAADAAQTALDVIATAADRVQTGLDADATAADAAQTALDVIATAADRVQTGLDVIATAADRVQTGLDADATAADRIQTGLDVIATNADAAQTALDVIATAADRVQTGLDADATAADRVQTGIDATTASDKADEAEASAISAANSATTAQTYAATAYYTNLILMGF